MHLSKKKIDRKSIFKNGMLLPLKKMSSIHLKPNHKIET